MSTATKKSATKATKPAKTAPAKTPKAAKPKVEKAPRVKGEEKNGITRPLGTGATAQVWIIADKLSAKSKSPALRSEVIPACIEAGINEATATTQYGRWRTFNGLVGRSPRPEKAAKPAKVKAPKADKPAKAKAGKKSAAVPPPPGSVPPPPASSDTVVE